MVIVIAVAAAVWVLAVGASMLGGSEDSTEGWISRPTATGPPEGEGAESPPRLPGPDNAGAGGEPTDGPNVEGEEPDPAGEAPDPDRLASPSEEEIRRAIAGKSATLGEALRGLLAGLRSEDRELRLAAVDKLAQLGPLAKEAVPALPALLETEDAGGKRGIMGTLVAAIA